MVDHRAGRPGWQCQTCEQPWPCSPARVALAEEYADNTTALSVYMALCLYDAVAELPALPPTAELFARFLAWTRPPVAAWAAAARPGRAALRLIRSPQY